MHLSLISIDHFHTELLSLRFIPFRVQIVMAVICRLPLTPVIIAILCLEDNEELNYTVFPRNTQMVVIRWSINRFNRLFCRVSFVFLIFAETSHYNLRSPGRICKFVKQNNSDLWSPLIWVASSEKWVMVFSFFAVAEGWLLLDIGWFVLFFLMT